MPGIKSFIKKNNSILLFSVYVFISFMMIGINTKTFDTSPGKLGLEVFSMFQAAIKNTASFISNTVNSIQELKYIKTDYEKLKKREAEFSRSERELVEVRSENERLRKLLGFVEKTGYDFIAAEITGKDPGNLFNTIIINKGTADGVKPDMTVTAFQDGFMGLVGKIVSSGKNNSIIKPVYDNSAYVAVRLQEARYEGLLNGGGTAEKDLVMSYVKKIARNEINFGDLVVTSGMRSLYPENIYIGRVSSIIARDYETSLKLYIKPIVDFSRLEYVFIIKGVN
jgi:rod shape-determining protein MreC